MLPGGDFGIYKPVKEGRGNNGFELPLKFRLPAGRV
jgi:hypothetical protein